MYTTLVLTTRATWETIGEATYPLQRKWGAKPPRTRHCTRSAGCHNATGLFREGDIPQADSQETLAGIKYPSFA